MKAKAEGVWLSGKDPIPTHHTTHFPPDWDYNETAPLDGLLIDNCYTGWDGRAEVVYPDRGLLVTMTMSDSKGYSLLYRPTGLPFCYEPITQPIDAFHMEGRPGLVVLGKGENQVLRMKFEFETLSDAYKVA